MRKWIEDNLFIIGLLLIIVSTLLLVPIGNVTGDLFYSVLHIILVLMGVVLVWIEDRRNMS